MLDCEDVGSVLALLDEKVLDTIDDLMTVLEDHKLADDGELEEGSDLEDAFEDLDSKDQKKVEKAIRKALKDLAGGVGEVEEEITGIDDEVLGEKKKKKDDAEEDE